MSVKANSRSTLHPQAQLDTKWLKIDLQVSRNFQYIYILLSFWNIKTVAVHAHYKMCKVNCPKMAVLFSFGFLVMFKAAVQFAVPWDNHHAGIKDTCIYYIQY